MNRTSRTATVLVAAAALAVPAGLVSSAEAAKPKSDHATKTVKAQTKQLLKDISGKDRRLARLSTRNAVVRLVDTTEVELVANIDDARTVLAELRSGVEAADSTVDTRAARKELRSFRVENFRIVVNVLRKAEKLADAAAADPLAAEHLAAGAAAALEIDAYSTKSDIREARALVRSAQAELETDDEDEVETD